MNKDIPLTSDELAVQRTLMASERTYMAWTRTALSLISFGFAIPKVLEHTEEPRRHLLGDHGPRIVGITLVGLGVFVLLVSSLQHWRLLKKSKLEHRADLFATGLSYAMAFVLFVLGVLALLSLVFQIGPL